ncbi:class I SAM-dependent methyltransferase [Acetivibrio cellulolyticus]|uniref:class I SAM-dependent methyltransferase n=1 Tax=Acetivibrio cellulolyticus TaxID=35830 RepID=UPI0001E2F5A0|nr:class I SAM-dependent methyltransferase [Acetivibrio cellulolyticus]
MVDNFKEKAINWDKNPVIVSMSNAFQIEMLKNVNMSKDFDIMEFGCGTGLAGLNFSSSVNSVFMVDTSPAMLSVLQDKVLSGNIHNVKILEGNITDLDLKESSFDVVFSLMTLHHIENIPEVLKACFTIIKDNGYLIIGDLVEEDGSFHGEERVAHCGFNLSEIKKMFNGGGFTVTSLYKYYTVEKPDVEGNIRRYEQFILVSQKMTD